MLNIISSAGIKLSISISWIYFQLSIHSFFNHPGSCLMNSLKFLLIFICPFPAALIYLSSFIFTIFLVVLGVVSWMVEVAHDFLLFIFCYSDIFILLSIHSVRSHPESYLMDSLMVICYYLDISSFSLSS